MIFGDKFKSTGKSDDTYIVGIGASAGGLEAINELFDNVSDRLPVAFIVVQHLSSDHKSLLVELLGRHTHMPVVEATHHKMVERGHVYVIPNNRDLTIQNGLLVLSEKENDKGPNVAIDTFLHSLAQDQQQFAMAVILSGTGTDGTKGIEAIKNYGGFVIVQEPSTAKFDGMPKSAISSGYIDLISAPADICNHIENYIDGILPEKEIGAKVHNDHIQAILSTVYKKTGYDFTQYKYPTIVRRINRRMDLVRIQELQEYRTYIQQGEDEANLLAKEFFIGVTSFFRDKDAFAALYKHVILKLVQEKEEQDFLKVWVMACSTGQEAYTIAILIDRALQEKGKSLDVKIFASDIDPTSISTAARGKFQRHQLLGIDEKLVDQYFFETEEGMTVIPRIRKQIVFATHDVLKDPPFIKNDLVCCRNLLIYLNAPLQENVLGNINFALNPGGYLFLGTSESPSLFRRGFSEIDSKWKIYQRISEENSVVRRINTLGRTASPAPLTATGKVRPSSLLNEDFKKVLADEFGFAAVYINDNYEIKEGIGNFKKYLSLPEKLNTFSILKMAPAELSSVLSTGLRKCMKENKRQIIRKTKVRYGDKHTSTDIYVYPPSETLSGLYCMIVFADSVAETKAPIIQPEEIQVIQKDDYVQQLEEELQETKNNLQLAIEGLETANEELQSSNEELQSANEELQSSNEELQSLNEELHTLNTEHQLRIRELVELNDDLNNYLQSSLIGQIFLDQQLRIRRFNKVASSVINIIDGDIGRPIDHITNQIRSKGFVEDLKKVVKTGTVVEREIELNSGAFYLVRLMPYLKQDKIHDGIVITLVEITTMKNLNSLIKTVFESTVNPLFVFESVRNDKGQVVDFRCDLANDIAYTTFNLQGHGSCLLKEHLPELASPTLWKKYQATVESGTPASTEISFTRGDHRFWFLARINQQRDGFVLLLSDISSRKEAEEKLRKNYNELLIAKESLKELNNQLEEKVAHRTRDLQVSEERFRMVASLTNDVIWDWNFAENKLWWSEGYSKLLGLPNAAYSALTHSQRLQHVVEEDRPRVQNAFAELLNGKQQELNIGYRVVRANGEIAHVVDRAVLISDEQHMPYRMIGAMVDVTKLEVSSEQLRQKNHELESLINQFRFVTDFMPQMVWATQPDGYHDFYNQQWYEYTGLNFEQTKDKGWSTVLHPEDRERAWTIWKHSLATGTPYDIEYRMRKHTGEYRWFLGRALPLRDSQGKIVKWFGTCTDIDDQKRAEKVLEERIGERTRELRQVNQRLESSNTDLMQFASVASHDLKEPLRKIHFYTDMLRKQYAATADEKVISYLDRIKRSSSRATSLIDDVLSYSRLSSENLFERVDMEKIVMEILQDFELVIQEKKAQIELSSLPVIEAVPGQMRQLFQNIIGNALKFHLPGKPPEIFVTCDEVTKEDYPELHDNEGLHYQIRIRDTGIGFDEQYSRKIFSLFQRLNSKEQYEGTGIGLAIAYKIVERHNGIIHAHGVENKGAEFTIVLPQKQPKRSEES